MRLSGNAHALRVGPWFVWECARTACGSLPTHGGGSLESRLQSWDRARRQAAPRAGLCIHTEIVYKSTIDVLWGRRGDTKPANERARLHRGGASFP